MKKRENKIHLCLAHMGGAEQRYVQEAFDTNWVTPLGPNVNAFEDELASYLGEGKHVVCLSSGTAALHLALIQCGVTRGDVVICQTFTFCASANPIVYLGAEPMFVDSEVDSWNMDPLLLERAIVRCEQERGRLPKAIVYADLYGMPAKAESIARVAKKYGIPTIEDAAEALGSFYGGKKCGKRCGTWGDYGVLSFNGNKMITTSGGGALVCPDEDVRQKVLKLATQAREPFPFYQHEQIGYNYRLSNVCAGIGRGQMLVLEEHIRHHRHLAELYRESFSCVEGIRVHDEPDELSHSNFWLSTVLLSEDLKVSRMDRVGKYEMESPNSNVEALRRCLEVMNVETRPLWKPLHLQPIFATASCENRDVALRLFRQGLCLPSGPCVTDEDVKYIVETIKSALI